MAHHVVARTLAAGAVNGAVLVATLGLSLLAAEGVTRWIYRGVTTTADFRGYFTTKWMRTQVRHNHYDYRGAEFDEVTPAGTYRVAVMGDSFTYGNGVPEDLRFSNLVGAAVHDRGIEVLNFGYPGNNWPEHVKTLERRVLRLRPDYVLLQWGTNDVELDRDVAGRPLVPPLIGRRDWHEALYRQSALSTLLNAQWIRLQLTREMGDTYPAYMARLYGDARSDGAVQADALMRRFLELCRSRGVGVGIVLFPDAAVSLGADYAYRFLHERTLATCAAEGVTCVDLLPRFSGAREHGARDHEEARGHQRASEHRERHTTREHTPREQPRRHPLRQVIPDRHGVAFRVGTFGLACAARALRGADRRPLSRWCQLFLTSPRRHVKNVGHEERACRCPSEKRARGSPWSVCSPCSCRSSGTPTGNSRDKSTAQRPSAWRCGCS